MSIHVIGMGAAGLSGLHPKVRECLSHAALIVGGARHLDMVAAYCNAEMLPWPSPFEIPVAAIQARVDNAQQVVILATGDPLWFGIGRHLHAAFPGQVHIHAHLSAFQLAAQRMQWALEDVQTLSVHGRPVDLIQPFFNPGQKLLILSAGGEMAREVAALLQQSGHGMAHMYALCHMEGENEITYHALAKDWQFDPPALHTLAIECAADAPPQGCLGLPDDAFVHDGKMTKQSMRAVTLARLCPTPGAVLWDLGTGCGSVLVEWLRATAVIGQRGHAIGVDINAERLETAMRNAVALGASDADLRHQSNMEFLSSDSPMPDAVFIGGGLSAEVVAQAHTRLKVHGRLVCNSVTLESEAILLDSYARYGGHLERLSVQTAVPVGHMSGWRASMPVLQWSLQK